MGRKACEIVWNYILKRLDSSEPIPVFDVFIVWQCKVLQNWKFLIQSSLSEGIYYEVTYNGDTREWYLDVFRKSDGQVTSEEA